MKQESRVIPSPVLYLQKQYELLKEEYDYEKKQFEQQTEAMGIGRKIKRGCAGIRSAWGEVIIMR